MKTRNIISKVIENIGDECLNVFSVITYPIYLVFALPGMILDRIQEKLELRELV